MKIIFDTIKVTQIELLLSKNPKLDWIIFCKFYRMFSLDLLDTSDYSHGNDGSNIGKTVLSLLSKNFVNTSASCETGRTMRASRDNKNKFLTYYRSLLPRQLHHNGSFTRHFCRDTESQPMSFPTTGIPQKGMYFDEMQRFHFSSSKRIISIQKCYFCTFSF